MGATVYYLLMLQKFSKQIQRKYPLCLGNIAKDFTSVNMKKNKKQKKDSIDMSTNFLLIVILLILVILSVFINI